MRHLSSFALLLASLVGLTFSLAAAAIPTISGRVTRSADASAVSGAVVTAFVLTNPTQNANTTTNANGDFVLNVPGVGNYHVHVTANGLVEEFWDNVPDFSSATPVVVNANVSAIDFALEALGRISGQVRRSGDLAALADVTVQAETTLGSASSSVASQSDGSYFLEMPAGDYRVRTSNGLGRIDQLHAAIDCPYAQCDSSAGAIISVSAGGTVSGIDFTLAPGAVLAGQVLANAAPPVSNTLVTIYANNGTSLTTAAVQPDGSWQMGAGLLPGNYRASAGPEFGLDYGSQLWQNHACGGVFQDTCDPALGDAIAVTAPGVVGNIDFALLRVAASLGGTVVRLADASPVEGAGVDVLDTQDQVLASTATDANGDWLVSPLPSGAYRVRVNAVPPLLEERWPGVQCFVGVCSAPVGDITLAAGEQRGDIDFAMAEMALLNVAVRNADTGLAVSGAQLSALLPGSSVAQQFGSTTIPVLGGGGVRFAAGGGACGPSSDRICRSERWPGDDCALFACDLAAGQTIAVAKGSIVNTDLELSAGGRISGVVRSAVDASALSGILIQLYGANGTQLTSALSAGDGSYVIAGLSSGPYFARSAAPSGYLDQLYASIPCPMGRCDPPTGTPLAPSVGGDIANVDFSLPRGGAISGRLREHAIDLPIVGATVEIYDASGQFAVQTSSVAQGLFLTPALPSGNYFLRAESPQHEAVLFQNLPCANPGCDPSLGTPIEVVAPATQGGLELRLIRLSATPLSPPIAYLNRCIGGCTIHPGFDDAIQNTSTIVGIVRNLSPYTGSDADFNAIVACVRSVMAPYYIAITSVDPGNVPHREVMIAGTQQQGGYDPSGGSVFGVAPFSCGQPINNAIAFTYINSNPVGTKFNCETAAHELGHLLGLDHEVHVPDIMSYTDQAHLKHMENFESGCFLNNNPGNPGPCACGNAPTQNSYLELGAELGFDRMFQNSFGDPEYPVPLSEIFSVGSAAGIRCGTRTDRITPIPAAWWIDGPAFSK